MQVRAANAVGRARAAELLPRVRHANALMRCVRGHVAAPAQPQCPSSRRKPPMSGSHRLHRACEYHWALPPAPEQLLGGAPAPAVKWDCIGTGVGDCGHQIPANTGVCGHIGTHTPRNSVSAPGSVEPAVSLPHPDSSGLFF
eukprot:scaffold5285_cov137-Isochrysis_galbana.AAC.2